MKSAFVAVVIVLVAVTHTASAQNVVEFENKSGRPVFVKLIGPTYEEIIIPKDGSAKVPVSTGLYTFRVRYGANGSYRYSRGQKFRVEENEQTWNQMTITLQMAEAEDFSAHPISRDRFETTDPSSLCNCESEIGSAWARFILNENIIPAEKRIKLRYAFSVGCAYAGMMLSDEVLYIDPEKIDFHPIALSKVVNAIGNWSKEENENNFHLYRWCGLVLKKSPKTENIVAFGFTKEFIFAHHKNPDIVAEADKCVQESAQHEAAVGSSEWREAEHKLCDLIGLPYLPFTLDRQKRTGVLGYSVTAERVNLTDERIKKVCGNPTYHIDGDKIYSGTYYGRVGYKIKAGRLLPDLWVFYAISSVRELAK